MRNVTTTIPSLERLVNCYGQQTEQCVFSTDECLAQQIKQEIDAAHPPQLGRTGGFGAVIGPFHPQLAIKQFKDIEKAQREIQALKEESVRPILSQLKHPNVGRILSVVDTDNWKALVMPAYNGGDLQQLLDSDIQLCKARVINIIINIIKGTYYERMQTCMICISIVIS